MSLTSRLARLERAFTERSGEVPTCRIWVPDNGRNGPQPSVDSQLREGRNTIVVPREEWPLHFPDLARKDDGEDVVVITTG